MAEDPSGAPDVAERSATDPNPLAARTFVDMPTTLLAVTGMSPAILTETVWALAHAVPARLPHRLIPITTVGGAAALERLHRPSPALGGISPWESLRASLQRISREMELPILEPARVLTVPNRAEGRAEWLEDLRTPRENDAAADFILEVTRSLVENPTERIVASIAGGRKTMGALLYAAMTLLGRETDRVTHVLVNEPFERTADFWHPEQPGGKLRGPAGETLDPHDALVQLAEVPFVPLRNLFRREIGRSAGSFSELIHSCSDEVRRKAASDLQVTVRQSRPELEVNGERIQPAPREHILLLFLAVRCKQRASALSSFAEAVEPLNCFRLELREGAPADTLADWRHGDALDNPFHVDDEIRRALSSLRRKLRSLGPDGATLAALLPEKGRFSLELDPVLLFLS